MNNLKKFTLDPDSGNARVIIKPQGDDNNVVMLLVALLEDARRGGITTLACVAVSPAGFVQTPAQGHQVREVARGIDALRTRMAETYDRAVREAMLNPEAPLRPMVGN